MVSFRASGQLACFYCGQQSSSQAAPGRKHSFVCGHCDATNYLDADGGIMDPPVATERESAPKRYVARGAGGGDETVFCSRCLENQHLFTRCLAQYSNNREDFVLNREYYSFRKQQEQRYPQVCDACAVKVQQRILRAGYTAKTDHLRRMMDMSRGKRIMTTEPTRLDYVSAIGRATWRAGFVLEMLWHAKAVVFVLANSMPLSAALVDLLAYLPATHRLASWSIAAAFASAWWNPHFVQVNRGFTRHLLGLTQWYCFQGLIIFFRLASRGLLSMNQSKDACLSAHLAMAVVMMLMHVYAHKSIRVDTSMLFSWNNASSIPPPSPRTAKENDCKTFSQLVDETLESASPQSQARHRGTAATGHRVAVHTPVHRRPRAPEPDEMDWSPMAAPHRALLNQHNATRNAPDLGANPFRYPVPPAPFNPANRAWGRPLEAQEPQQSIPPAKASLEFGRHGNPVWQPSVSSHAGVEFKPPSFFAQPSMDDDNSLAALLDRSFTISQPHGHDSGEETEVEDRVQQVSARIPGIRLPAARKKQKLLCGVLSYEWLLLMVMLGTWMLSTPRRAMGST
ncbi:hypothetical protein CDD82_2008 [Ophiocordyceps australis]|uniref:Ima1 N-terminal domain-containing protein n=1 Tax=Ophiocordyceps australis TaxID=1399860 RepID=A0A2C5Y4I4_9HYPO|nr:hypothetical protein CDD82_2008 [Ophiocordyceps australis]